MANPKKGTYHLRPTGVGFALAPAGGNATTTMSTSYNFIHVWSDADVHMKFATPATADENSLWIKANTPYIFPIDKGGTIAFYGTATVECHYME